MLVDAGDTHEPTGPEPVVTNTVSPGLGVANSFQPIYAVKPAGKNEGENVYTKHRTISEKALIHTRHTARSKVHG